MAEQKNMTLYEKALSSMLASRFAARADDLNRPLTDDETRAEARYQFDDLPFKGIYEGAELRRARAQMKRLFTS